VSIVSTLEANKACARCHQNKCINGVIPFSSSHHQLGSVFLCLNPSRPIRITPFKQQAPKSFFKALFIKPRIGSPLETMTLSKEVADGLKPQECAQGSGQNKPPIPYIPEKDKLQEAVGGTANMIKLTLPGKVELPVSMWSLSTPEQFIMHIQQAINAIKQKGLKEAYNKLVGTENPTQKILPQKP